MASGSDPKAVVDATAAAVLTVMAFVTGVATRPWFDRLFRWIRILADRRRSVQNELLESLQQLLPELQKAAEASADAEAYRRCLALNLEVIELRDRVAKGRIRESVDAYQRAVMQLAEIYRAEAARSATGQAGEVSGEQALERVHSLLLARQSAWEDLAQVLARLSGELRRS